LRIVYLNPVSVLGGAERSLLDMMAAVRQTDPSTWLHLIVSSDGPLVEQARARGVGTTVLPMTQALLELGDSGLKGPNQLLRLLSLAGRGTAAGFSIRHYANRLGRTIEALRPDVIHSNGIKSHLLTRLARLKRRPVLWHIRDFLTSRPLMARALRWAASRPERAVAISEAIRHDTRTVLPRLPIDVVYNAIDTNYFSPGPADGRRLDYLAGLPPAEVGTARIALLATFNPWKGHEVFLAAAAELLRQQPRAQVRFYLVGGPIYQTRGSQLSKCALQAKAAELGIAQRVGFIDFQQDTAEIYRALDIVVNASTEPEPFGRTIVEAMACAKPVIVAQAGGAVELFRHGHDAFGVPPGDVAALASAIYHLLANRDYGLRLGANARLTAERRFARERLGSEMLTIYHQLLRDSTTRSSRESQLTPS
jgi:glycosyltransferase involved in cell wall biosynthesis